MLYFIISAIGVFFIGIQNLNGNDNSLCIGSYTCSVFSKTIIMLLHVIYVLFWTFTLDLYCKNDYKELSWFIVLVPIILSFVFFGIIMLSGKLKLE
jgi:hypothetical protein